MTYGARVSSATISYEHNNLHFDGGKQRIFFPTPWTPRPTPRQTSHASLYFHQPSRNYRCTSPYPRPSLSNYRRAYHTPSNCSRSSHSVAPPTLISSRINTTNYPPSLLTLSISAPILPTTPCTPPIHLNAISHTTSSSSIELPNFSDSILSSDQTKHLVTLIHSFPNVFTTTTGRTNQPATPHRSCSLHQTPQFTTVPILSGPTQHHRNATFRDA